MQIEPTYEADAWIWDEPSAEMRKGLELAAYICRMYGDGNVWAEAILSHGEQVRGRWWMEYERRAERIAREVGDE